MLRALRIAIAAVASLTLYTGAVYVGPFATPLVLLVPIAGVLLSVIGGIVDAAVGLALAAVAIDAVLGTAAACGFILPLALPGLVMGVGLRSYWQFERTAVAAIASWTGGVALLALIAYGGVASVIATMHAQLDHGFAIALASSQSLGGTEEAIALLQTERGALIQALVELMPALLVLTGTVLVLANLVLVRSWTDVGRHVNLRLWRTPDALIWALIVSGFTMFLPVAAFAIPARNVFVILLGCYFCQGLAIVSYYLHRLRLPRAVRIAGYVLIAVQQVVTALVLALGIFDLWGNFRRLSTGSAGVRFHEGE